MMLKLFAALVVALGVAGAGTYFFALSPAPDAGPSDGGYAEAKPSCCAKLATVTEPAPASDCCAAAAVCCESAGAGAVKADCCPTDDCCIAGAACCGTGVFASAKAPAAAKADPRPAGVRPLTKVSTATAD
jgi:hypothetical protein